MDGDAECATSRTGAVHRFAWSDAERWLAVGVIRIGRTSLAGGTGAIARGGRTAARVAGECAVCAEGLRFRNPGRPSALSLRPSPATDCLWHQVEDGGQGYGEWTHCGGNDWRWGQPQRGD